MVFTYKCLKQDCSEYEKNLVTKVPPSFIKNKTKKLPFCLACGEKLRLINVECKDIFSEVA